MCRLAIYHANTSFIGRLTQSLILYEPSLKCSSRSNPQICSLAHSHCVFLSPLFRVLNVLSLVALVEAGDFRFQRVVYVWIREQALQGNEYSVDSVRWSPRFFKDI